MGIERVGLALSGGGYRAALFSAGVVDYLVHAGLTHRLSAVTSVSGSAYTNARLLRLDPGLNEIGSAAFRVQVRPLVEGISDGRVWLTRDVVGRGDARRRIWRMLMNDDGGQLYGESAIEHVFVATNLHDTEPIYFGSHELMSPTLGRGNPLRMALRDAVSATAAIPFVFAPDRIDTSLFQDGVGAWPPSIACADGGLVDTLAMTWFRVAAPGGPRAVPDALIVVDGSGSVPRSRIVPRVPTSILRSLPGVRRVGGSWRGVSIALDRHDRMTFTRLRKRFVGGAATGVAVTVRESPLELTTGESRRQLLRLGVDWPAVVRANEAVWTMPRRLGRERALWLLYHGHVTAWAAHTASPFLGDPMPPPAPLAAFRAGWNL